MDKRTLYQYCIREVIKRHSQVDTIGDVAIQKIFDTENDHYQLVHAGWNRKHREYGCIMHLDIINGKIWVQHDGTEVGVANDLAELGVPKEDIVLAYHPPYKRKYTGFGIG